MRYYLIAGEASGDLHASRLMRSLKARDSQAIFRVIGGDLMAGEGGELVRHYRDMAYMGFIPVLMHLPAILSGMRMAKADILSWRPDAVILIDYPGFNLEIARHVRSHSSIPVYYYISPKIWAWKEYRIRSIRRDVDQMFSILPFEVDFYRRHGYGIHYVGNPTKDEVSGYIRSNPRDRERFCRSYGLDGRPVVALLAGSRKQEIKDNLPYMLKASRHFPQCQFVIAGAPSIDPGYYSRFLEGYDARLLFGRTYEILHHADAALVTSGTATLETALFSVPQVVCYKTPLKRIVGLLKRHLLSVRHVSLVNLVAGHEVVRELVADTFSLEAIVHELALILPGGERRERMLEEYKDVDERLGSLCAPDRAAELVISLLGKARP